jgi:cytidylate kinase
MENKQIIVSIGREFGSAGHEIAEDISKKLGLALYDYNLLKEIADDFEVDSKQLEEYDEIPRIPLFSRTVNGYNNSPQYNIAMMQFEYLHKKAEAGESFVVVGRCSEEILKDFDCMIPIFVLGDMPNKIKRIAALYKMDEKEAYETIIVQDKKRKNYHNYFCKGKWGDSRNYEMCINSSHIGVEATVDIILDYIKLRTGKPL